MDRPRRRNQVSKLKGLVGLSDIKSNEAIRLNNLNPRTSIWLSGWSERNSHWLLCSVLNGWTGSPNGKTPTPPRMHSSIPGPYG